MTFNLPGDSPACLSPCLALPVMYHPKHSVQMLEQLAAAWKRHLTHVNYAVDGSGDKVYISLNSAAPGSQPLLATIILAGQGTNQLPASFSMSCTTRKNASPYFASLACPTPLICAIWSRPEGRRFKISSKVLS